MPPQKQRPVAAVQRLTLTRQEAAKALGVSIQHFERHVQPDLRVVPSGQLVLVPMSELERWCKQNARHLAA